MAVVFIACINVDELLLLVICARFGAGHAPIEVDQARVPAAELLGEVQPLLLIDLTEHKNIVGH